MRAVGQIALDMELVYVDMILRALDKMPNITTLGGLVDCNFYSNRGFNNPVWDFVDRHEFPSGKAMFKIKLKDVDKVPRHPPANQESSMKVEPLQPWMHLYEALEANETDDFIQALISNGGGMILVPGGVGKTVLVNELIASIRANCAERVVIPKIHPPYSQSPFGGRQSPCPSPPKTQTCKSVLADHRRGIRDPRVHVGRHCSLETRRCQICRCPRLCQKPLPHRRLLERGCGTAQHAGQRFYAWIGEWSPESTQNLPSLCRGRPAF